MNNHGIMNSDSATTELISILRNVLSSPTIIRTITDSAESNVLPAQLQSETHSESRTLFGPLTTDIQASITRKQRQHHPPVKFRHHDITLASKRR